MKRWTPREEMTEQEKTLLGRPTHVRKLFAFLRMHRQEIFEEAFQEELEAIYSRYGAGLPAIPPAFLCVSVLLQSYVVVSDAEALDLTVVDLRRQMILDFLGQDKPTFSQGSLLNFRIRLIDENLGIRLLERTVEVAQRKEFDYKKLPDTLRAAGDSRHLVAAGRVEDSIDWAGRAATKVVRTAARILEIGIKKICGDGKASILVAPSMKSGPDINWNDDEQKASGLQVLDT